MVNKMVLQEAYIAILKRMFKLFPEKKAVRIYHYTSKEVLWEFLKHNADFKCTYFRELSDPTEFTTGLGYVIQICRGICDNGDMSFMAILQDFLGMTGRYEKNMLPWTMSFSSARDETCQWRAYTDRQMGGYAVGFDRGRIEKIIYAHECLTQTKSSMVFLLPCVYVGDDRQEKLRNLMEYVFINLANDLELDWGKGVSEKDARERAVALLFFLMASVVKHKDFKEEQEWRLVVLPMKLSEAANEIEMVGGKLRVSTGLWGRTNKLSDLIAEVVVSPHGPAEHLLGLAETFFAIRNIGDGNKRIVVASGSPYRGG